MEARILFMVMFSLGRGEEERRKIKNMIEEG